MNREFEFYGASDCHLVKGRYKHGNTLALEVHSRMYGPMAKITINIKSTMADETSAFLNTNACPEVEDLVESLGIGQFSGVIGRSGYCLYPLYEFDMAKIDEYT